jgi:hypothetical protein
MDCTKLLFLHARTNAHAHTNTHTGMSWVKKAIIWSAVAGMVLGLSAQIRAEGILA